MKLIDQENTRENPATSSCKTISEPSLSRQQVQSGIACSRKIPEVLQDTTQSHELGITNMDGSNLLRRNGKILLFLVPQ